MQLRLETAAVLASRGWGTIMAINSPGMPTIQPGSLAGRRPLYLSDETRATSTTEGSMGEPSHTGSSLQP
jgi:hypothetical protein